jgi:hypothetical protein
MVPDDSDRGTADCEEPPPLSPVMKMNSAYPRFQEYHPHSEIMTKATGYLQIAAFHISVVRSFCEQSTYGTYDQHV